MTTADNPSANASTRSRWRCRTCTRPYTRYASNTEIKPTVVSITACMRGIRYARCTHVVPSDSAVRMPPTIRKTIGMSSEVVGGSMTRAVEGRGHAHHLRADPFHRHPYILGDPPSPVTLATGVDPLAQSFRSDPRLEDAGRNNHHACRAEIDRNGPPGASQLPHREPRTRRRVRQVRQPPQGRPD